MPRSSALLTIPCAIVCSESRSTAAAIRSASSALEASVRGDVDDAELTPRQRAGLVEDHGGELARLLETASIADEQPDCVRRDVVEMATTNGTASPSACGQAMTSTETSRSTANAPVAPSASHTTSVSAPVTDGDDASTRTLRGQPAPAHEIGTSAPVRPAA